MTPRTKEARGGRAVVARRGSAAASDRGLPETAPVVQEAGASNPPAGEPAALPVHSRSEFLPIHRIRPSGTNPKSRSDEKAVADLTNSVRRHGVLQPILVRAVGDGWVVVCGERRLTAAKAAGLDLIPAIIRDITEVEALELQLVENVQRQDLHPLEEAEGYQRLVSSGYTVAKIAERTGRSVAYVYDRMKLVNLSQRAKNLFLDDVLTPGHAILLARLKPMDQDRALKLHECIFEERLLLRLEGPEADRLKTVEPEGGTRFRAVSVRELASWIDKNVRFDGAAPDPLLFPETAEALAGAREGERKVVAITYEQFVPDHAREGKTYCRRSWKRADGRELSKKCPRAVLGFVAVGPRRGEAFDVCIDKDRCEVHWGAEIRRRKAAGKVTASEGVTGDTEKSGETAEAKKPSWQVAQDTRVAAENAAQEAWTRIQPRVIEAAIEKVKVAPAGGRGPLAPLLLSAVRPYGGGSGGPIPLGSSAEDLVRHAVGIWLVQQLKGYGSHERGPKIARQLGVDIAKLRKEAAPKKPAKPARKKKRGKRGGR